MLPAMFAVRSLYSLQKPMMLMPCWPSAGPIGWAGVALPAGICSLTIALTRFAMCSPLRSQGQWGSEWRNRERAARALPHNRENERGRERHMPRRRAPFLYYRTGVKMPADTLREPLDGNVDERLHLLNLQEVKLDGGLAAKEGDEHRDLVALGMDLTDLTDELGERTVDHFDALADGEVDLRLGLGGRLLALLGRSLQDVAQLAFR